MNPQNTATVPDIDTAAQWRALLDDASLRDLPYKIEINGEGTIEMSPAGNKHAKMQAQMIGELSRRPGGTVLGECGVQTSDGVRTPDASWVSDARMAVMAAQGSPDPLPIAPEVCVEVMSPSNTRAEMDRKAHLYFEAGAEEVWIVSLDGAKDVRTR